ncbi:zinc finger transcription factor ace1 [Apiospora arundinis]
MQTIGVLVRECLESFDSVLSQRTDTEGTTDAVIVLVKIKDEQDKFKVWSGNIGAHRKGTSSLDYRLRDASNLREEVQSLLQELLESLADCTVMDLSYSNITIADSVAANKILDGEVQPWDEEMSPDSQAEQQNDDEEVDEFGFESELEQLLADICEIVNYLYKVSAGLRNASQHDRVMSSLSIDMAHFETYDIEHVRNKHPKVEYDIAKRLGKAISKRRHYFKYRESHRGKLGSGLEAGGDRLADGQSTIASSLPDSLKKAEPADIHLNVDDNSESGFTQTSFATSVADSANLRVPPPPKEARTQEYFECPFCFMVLSAQTRRAWKLVFLFIHLHLYLGRK